MLIGWFQELLIVDAGDCLPFTQTIGVHGHLGACAPWGCREGVQKGWGYPLPLLQASQMLKIAPWALTSYFELVLVLGPVTAGHPLDPPR